jgi:hypothetical protein
MSELVFVSHAPEDGKVANLICGAMESRGLQCWLAERHASKGAVGASIVRAIRSARVMVLVFTSSSNNSLEIKRELALASQHKLAVIPVRVEDVAPSEALAYELATRQWINLFGDWEIEIDNLCSRIRALLPTASAPRAVDTGAANSQPQLMAQLAPPPNPSLLVACVLLIAQALMIIGENSFLIPDIELSPAIIWFPIAFGTWVPYLPELSYATALAAVALLLRIPRARFAGLAVCAVGTAAYFYLTAAMIFGIVIGFAHVSQEIGRYTYLLRGFEAVLLYLYPPLISVAFLIYAWMCLLLWRNIRRKVGPAFVAAGENR